MSDHEMNRYYRDRAPEYEQIYYRDIPARRQEIEEEEKRLENLVADRKVLELACGTGYWTQVMSHTAEEIIAVDISEEMLTEAKKKNYDTTVHFLKGNLYEMTFEPETYDRVALGFWYSHHRREKQDQLLAILGAPLKVDGAIWLIDNNPPAEGSSNDSVRVDSYGNNYKKRRLNDGREFVVLKNYFSREELEKTFSGSFKIRSLIHGHYYWSAVLARK